MADNRSYGNNASPAGTAGYDNRSFQPDEYTTYPNPPTSGHQSNSPIHIGAHPPRNHSTPPPAYFSSAPGYVSSAPEYVSPAPGYASSAPEYRYSTPGYTTSAPTYNYITNAPRPLQQASVPILAQQELFTRKGENTALITGAILVCCGVLDVIMLILFLVRFPMSLYYFTIAFQSLLCLVTGILLIAASRSVSYVSCNYACSILLTFINIILAFVHAVTISQYFNRGYYRYVDHDGNTTMGSLLGINLVTLVTAMVAMYIDCMVLCCYANQGVKVGLVRAQPRVAMTTAQPI